MKMRLTVDFGEYTRHLFVDDVAGELVDLIFPPTPAALANSDADGKLVQIVIPPAPGPRMVCIWCKRTLGDNNERPRPRIIRCDRVIAVEPVDEPTKPGDVGNAAWFADHFKARGRAS